MMLALLGITWRLSPRMVGAHLTQKSGSWDCTNPFASESDLRRVEVRDDRRKTLTRAVCQNTEGSFRRHRRHRHEWDCRGATESGLQDLRFRPEELGHHAAAGWFRGDDF